MVISSPTVPHIITISVACMHALYINEVLIIEVVLITLAKCSVVIVNSKLIWKGSRDIDIITHKSNTALAFLCHNLIKTLLSV